jgi:type IV pilus assembly protein PilQ
LSFGVQQNRFTLGGNQATTGSTNTTGTVVPTLGGTSVNLPAGALNGTPAGTVALTLFNAAATKFIGLELSALEADGKGKIISSPRVITADQLKALIEQGTEIPYQQATSSGATSVSFRKANLKLEVTPQITPDGNVILDVDVTKDSVGIQTDSGLAIDTKHVKTQVLIDNGGTVVIGGIYTQTESKDISKVPFFGDIPLFGNLFKTTDRTNNKTELLIFLTPKVLNDKVAIK